MKRKISYKKLIASLLVLGMLNGCGQVDTKNATTEATTEATTQATTEATTENNTNNEPTFIDGELDITNNASIENEATSIYNDYKEYWDGRGLSVDDIRNMIFVYNDKYCDEDGNALLTEEEISRVFDNTEDLVVPYSLSKKVNNIARGTEDDIYIPEIPQISRFLDKSIPGAESTSELLDEHQEEINYQVNQLNNEGTYDLDHMNAYIVKQEYTNIQNNRDGFDQTQKNGHTFLLLYAKESAINLDGEMQPEGVNFVQYNGYNLTKVAPYNDEIKNESNYLIALDELRGTGVNLDEIKTSVYREFEEGRDITHEEIMATYGLSSEISTIVLDEVIYIQTMPAKIYGIKRCNTQKMIEDAFGEYRKTSSLNNNEKYVKKLIYINTDLA